MRAARQRSVSPAAVRKVALLIVIAYGLLVVSGGAVRLTGSGLGCPDWPSCFQHRLTATLSFHPMVEDVNRFVTVVVSVLSIVACAMALLRSPRRRDISIPALRVVAGLVAQIVLGGIVVLTKLNPYLVAFHFVLTLAVLAIAIVFYHRAGVPDEAATADVKPLVASDLRWLTRVLIGALAVMTAIGTMVTGSGPHAGGKGAKRVPIAFHSMAEVHSSIGWLILGLAAASVFAFHHAEAPERVQRLVRTFFELVVIQGALGYTQYFLHDSPVVVEFHLAGVTLLWVTVIGLYLSLHEHPLNAVPPDVPAGEPLTAEALTQTPASVR
ncbi:MAG: COX15/CtaA family protein [Acidimicrobiales bacterium]|jgi:cytochrome c oxidase assembly protein subunit 15